MRPAAVAARRIAGAVATVSRQPNRPQWHCGAIGLDDDVADLAGAVAVAAEQLAVEDEAGADAAPDLDRHEVAWPILAVEEERGERRPRGCRWRRWSGGRTGRAGGRRAAGRSRRG